MTDPRRDRRSHGEEYPASAEPGRESEEERYGVKRESPRPDRRRRPPSPAEPPPEHERHRRP
jgi:hypothetical protein